jgi:hypothetical protein
MTYLCSTSQQLVPYCTTVLVHFFQVNKESDIHIENGTFKKLPNKCQTKLKYPYCDRQQRSSNMMINTAKSAIHCM